LFNWLLKIPAIMQRKQLPKGRQFKPVTKRKKTFHTCFIASMKTTSFTNTNIQKLFPST